MRESHPTIALFDVEDGYLRVGGIRVDRLAARVGGTPFFAYDRRLITERIQYLRKHLPPAVGLSYAIKANPMPAVVQHLSTLVDSFDVASAHEMRTALDTPMPADRVSFAGPGKSLPELTQAVAAGVIIELESETEVERVAAIGESLGVRPSVAVRVNPDFQVKGYGMRIGGGPQQFGVDSEMVPRLLKQIATSNLDFVGFHVFSGSQNLRADFLIEAQRKAAELVLRLADAAPVPVRYLNLGGGFGVPYFEHDRPVDLRSIGRALYGVLVELIEPNFPEARTVIELGRYIVAESGLYVTRIVDRKESRGRTFLVVDGGMHHQLAASGNFGQIIRRNFPVVIGNKMIENCAEIATVVGCLCTPLDVLADNGIFPRADIGDLVVVFQAGAYGLTASPTAFLSHPAPMEVLV